MVGGKLTHGKSPLAAIRLSNHPSMVSGP